MRATRLLSIIIGLTSFGNVSLAIQSCTDAPLTDTNQWVRGDFKQIKCTEDFDKDGTEDVLSVRYDGSGSQFDNYWVQVKLSQLGEFNVDASFNFAAIVNVISIPDVLLNPGVDRLKGVVEKILFHEVYKQPDASLLRLLNPGPLQWHQGKPVMPDNYTITINKTGGGGRWLNGLNAKNQNAVWANYLGMNHRRSRKGGLTANFRTMDSNEKYLLYGTAHGVVLYNRSSDKHAWLYVFRGGFKLRWPSIRSANFNGDEIEIILNRRGYPIPGKIVVNSKTGAIRKLLEAE